jgi:hypothetical protein
VHTRFRRFLLIFMMLALPVQAFASMILLACEVSRPAEVQAAKVHDMSACHEAPAEKSGVPAGEHQCSHCAACYLSGAFPIPASATVLAAPIPYTPHLQRAEPFSGFIPEGPERPPRTPLA